MSDAISVTSEAGYRTFIREVFLAPIRTAVVVDDEFPTLDELLSLPDATSAIGEYASGLSPEKRRNKPLVKQIVELCRGQIPFPWLIDVHNGSTPSVKGEQSAASHFDHTDLLILDYHLDKNSDSERSIQILRRLAANGHFNLVVVYTKLRDERSIRDTLCEIALSLSTATPLAAHAQRSNTPDYVATKVDEWGDQHTGIFEKLESSIDDLSFLKVLQCESVTWAICQHLPELGVLASLMATIPPQLHLAPDRLFTYLIRRKQDSARRSMSQESFGAVTLDIDVDVNWIRTDSMFVTVISKECPPMLIPEKLLTALERWNPLPQRLVVSKMRAEMSARGGVAESNALRNRHLQAAWLDDLLVKYEPQRRTNVRQDVARHWENLGGVVSPGVVDFSNRLADFLASGVNGETVNGFRKPWLPEDKEQAFLHFNRYICSKEIQGHHLSTGHVLRIGSGANAEYWLCLSPACDLEPGQGSGVGWKKRLGDWMPLKAVRLYRSSALHARDSARANHIFLQIENEVMVFGFAEPDDMTDSIPPLRWEEFFAERGGGFSFDAKIVLSRIASVNSDLRFNPTSAIIVAQLRYEYAINLLQRLGAHLSRVGLDFRPFVAQAE